MTLKWLKRIIAGVAILVIVGGLVYALRPQPVSVDMAIVDRGPMEVTIDEEGIARIRDVFRVSAPISGRIDRLPVEVGDRVVRDETQLASLHPVDPPFHDVRTRRDLEAAVSAASAAVALAEAQVDSAETNVRLMRSELDRARQLADRATISVRAFEKAAADLDIADARVNEVRASLDLRKSELASAEARLIEPGSTEVEAETCCITVLAPADGTVLRLLSESEQVVLAGGPLLEIGDPRDLEIIVHLLSSDAVGVAPDGIARVDGWGGPALTARLRSIDPAAYTKVSALGIEEQRVDAIFDLIEAYESWQRLGHDYRVIVHIPTWQSEAALRLPLGALFRRGDSWHVFRVVDGVAKLTPVKLDHRNTRFAEVVDGLAAGEVVVLHPSDRVAEGASVSRRDVD